MAEWLYEAGIGEERAVLVERGAIVEARILRTGTLQAGAVVAARLRAKRRNQGELVLEGGGAALLQPLPPGIVEGARLTVEITREAIPERGNPKLPLARATDAPVRPAPNLRDELGPVRELRVPGPDALEEAGWSDLLDQAGTGLVPFPGGLLRIHVTPAMTLIDVDGDLPPDELARAGAGAAGAAIRRFGIGGSIGLDLPTASGKAARQAAAAALDEALPQPFERTAVNGFGFLQIVRRRVRPSLLELIQADPVRAAALALLRRVEREPTRGRGTLVAHPVVAALIEADYAEELARRTGFGLRADAAVPISGGHAEP